MTTTIDGIKTHFHQSIHELQQSTSLTQEKAVNKVLTQIDRLLSHSEGIAEVYANIPALLEKGLLDNTPWQDFDNLVPSLTSGTLKSGFPSNIYEMVSSLRVLAIHNQEYDIGVDHSRATRFLEGMLVQNLDLIFNHLSESDRLKMTSTEVNKLQVYFQFVLSQMSMDGITKSISEELEHLTAQKQIDTYKIRDIIQLVLEKMDLTKTDRYTKQLKQYVAAVNAPSPLASKAGKDGYAEALASADEGQLREEALALGTTLKAFGLASGFHASFVLHFYKERPELVETSLALSESGAAEWDKHLWFIRKLIAKTLDTSTRQSLYGLREVLERNLLSRTAVYNGLKALMTIKVHDEIKRKLKRSHWSSEGTPPLKTLMAGTLCILGQPLGIGQGLNPTCQSARGISLWSEHAPAKLVDMIIMVAEYNNIDFRFEGQLIESQKVGEGLAKSFDYNLDPVSIVLVPHLDRVYMEMMRRATLRTDDPHKWVNPAMYGQWIPTGFVSTYNYLTGTIHQFQLFMRHFIAALHPEYNGNRKLIYPIPVGIYITSAKGDMLGFHAVSILRVDWNPNRKFRRIYFLNPNNEGRQDWGQGIKPTVSQHGERPGESSLPFHEFASRVYAFHYNQMGIEERLDKIDPNLLNQITDLAKESWGKTYSWTN